MPMLLSADWVGAIGSCISALLALATLFILWRQLKDLNASVQGSTYQNIINQMLEIDRFFIANPKLKPYFYDGKDLGGADESERARAASVAEMLLDFFDNVYHQRELISEERYRAYYTYMTTLCGRSKVLQAQLDDSRDWYPPKFVCELRQSYESCPSRK